MSKLVFLGGTCGTLCARAEWRNPLIDFAVNKGCNVENIFNPVKPDWKPEHMQEEVDAKNRATLNLFHLANPFEPQRPPHSVNSLQQMVRSTFSARKITRIHIDYSFLDTKTARNIRAIATDIESKFPGTILESWSDLIDSIVSWWKANPEQMGYLPGTCGHNLWRDILFSDLAARSIDNERFFNPMVPANLWSPAVQFLEDQMERASRASFFFVGDPKETRPGASQVSPYSIAEAIFWLYRDWRRTVVSFDFTQWDDDHTLRSMNKLYEDMRESFPHARIYRTLTEAQEEIVRHLLID